MCEGRRGCEWLAEFFKAHVNAGKQYPVSNQLHSPPVAKAANLGQMAAADSYIAKGPSPGVPPRIVARNPAFDDPRFSTDDSLGKATHRSNAVLDVNDRPDIDGSYVQLLRTGRTAKSVRIVLANHCPLFGKSGLTATNEQRPLIGMGCSAAITYPSSTY